MTMFRCRWEYGPTMVKMRERFSFGTFREFSGDLYNQMKQPGRMH